MGVQNLTQDEILDNLSDWFVPDPETQLQDGDITVKMIAQKFGVSETLARRRMIELAKGQPEKWVCKNVKRRGHDVMVLRKVG